MENQHKAMLKRLVSGEFDEMAERLSATHYEPGVLADGTNTASYVNAHPARPLARTRSQRREARRAARARCGRVPKPAAAPVAKPRRRRASGAPVAAVRVSATARSRRAASARDPAAVASEPPQHPAADGARRRSVRPRGEAAAAAPTFFSESPVETPSDDLPTLFAEELISEKSLDEVILAFLSADLEPPK